MSTEEARSLATVYAPDVEGESAQQLAADKRMPDSVLFRVQKVRVKVDECDLPGPARRKVICSQCGHGGLCKDCPECSYPHCPFGKGM